MSETNFLLSFLYMSSPLLPNFSFLTPKHLFLCFTAISTPCPSQNLGMFIKLDSFETLSFHDLKNYISRPSRIPKICLEHNKEPFL